MKRLLFFSEPTKKDKRLAAVFYIDGKIKVINFGSKNGETFTLDHQDSTKRKNWVKRHIHNIEKFKHNPLAPITLAHRILWVEESLPKAIETYKMEYGL